jgi:hypothetical protein
LIVTEPPGPFADPLGADPPVPAAIETSAPAPATWAVPLVSCPVVPCTENVVDGCTPLAVVVGAAVPVTERPTEVDETLTLTGLFRKVIGIARAPFVSQPQVPSLKERQC